MPDPTLLFRLIRGLFALTADLLDGIVCVVIVAFLALLILTAWKLVFVAAFIYVIVKIMKQGPATT